MRKIMLNRSAAQRIARCISRIVLLGIVGNASAKGAVHSYDALNRMTSVTYSNGSRIEYTYDIAGNRSSYVATGPGATTSESVALASGGSPSISISNAGGPGATYDWYRDGAKISTTNVPSLAVSGFSPEHAGNYRVVVRETSGAVSIVELMVKLKGLSYESWLHHKEGPAATPADPGLARMASARSDGTQNILKYAMGKGPNESAGDSLPHIVWHGEGTQRRMGLKFSRIFDPADIFIRLEASGNLRDWRDVTAMMEPAATPVIAADGLTEEVTLLAPVTVSDPGETEWKFLRIAVDDLLVIPGELQSLQLPMGGDRDIEVSGGLPDANYEWYRDGIKTSTTAEPRLTISGFSPGDAGKYRVIVRGSNGATSIVELMVQLTGLTYESWLEFKEGAGVTPNDPGLGRMERARSDGVANLLKYAFGKGPNESVHSILPRAEWIGSGETRRLGITFRRIFDPADITIRVEASGDPLIWRDVTDEMLPHGNPKVAEDGLTEEVSLMCPVAFTHQDASSWRYLRIKVSAGASPVMLFTDDFLTPQIDLGVWTHSGSSVVQNAGTMQVLATQTDQWGVLASKPVVFDSNRSVRVVRMVKLRAANDYFMASTKILYGDLPPVYLRYYKMIYHSLPSYRAMDGFYICRNGANPHNPNYVGFADNDVSARISPLLDTWFEETIVYNPQSGDLRYFMDGVESGSFNVGILPLSQSPQLKLEFDPAGWNTGHEHSMQYIRVQQD